MQLPLFAASSPALEDKLSMPVPRAPADPAAAGTPQFQNVFADRTQGQTVWVDGGRTAPVTGMSNLVEDGVMSDARETAVSPGLATANILPAQDTAPKREPQANGEVASVRPAGPDVGLFAPGAAETAEEKPAVTARASVAPAGDTLTQSVVKDPFEQAGQKAPESEDVTQRAGSGSGQLTTQGGGVAKAHQLADIEAAMAAPALQGHGKHERQDGPGAALPERHRQAGAGTGAAALAGATGAMTGQAEAAGVRRDWPAVHPDRQPPSDTWPAIKNDHPARASADIAPAGALAAEPPRRAAPPSKNLDAAFRSENGMSDGGQIDLPASDPPRQAQTRFAVGESGQSDGASQAETKEKEGRVPPNGRAGVQGAASSTGPTFGPPLRDPAAPAPERNAPPALMPADVGESDRPFADVPVSEPRPLSGVSLPPHAPAPVHRPDLAHGVAIQVAEIISQTQDRTIELKLHPEELGRVSMTLAQDGGTLTVAVTAERGETLDLMRRNIDLLGEELRRLGYGSVDFTFGDGGAGEGALQRRAGPTGPGGQAHEMVAVDDAATSQARTPAPEAGSGHVDIRL